MAASMRLTAGVHYTQPITCITQIPIHFMWKIQKLVHHQCKASQEGIKKLSFDTLYAN